ncbi:MAG: hypothetical protein AAFY56_16130 [Pseudomonadota bacterium]
MNLQALLTPGGLAAAPVASWLLIIATEGLALLAVSTFLGGLATRRYSLFVIALLIAGVTAWITTWMLGQHDVLRTDWRASGWLVSMLVLALTTVVMARLLPTFLAFLVACLPLLIGLGIADVVAGRSLEWRLVGADRATLARDLGVADWLGVQPGSTANAPERPSWSDVAEAWRSYAEETKRLDEAIDRTDSPSEEAIPETSP